MCPLLAAPAKGSHLLDSISNDGLSDCASVFMPCTIKHLLYAEDRETLVKKIHTLSQAVDDAELAVAVTQRNLAVAEQSQHAAAQDAQAARHEADKVRSDLEQKVRMATEDGQLRIQLLEETVERLGGRSEANGEVARLSGEVSKLRRSEARLRSDLLFADSRVNKLAQQLDAARHTETADDAACKRAQSILQAHTFSSDSTDKRELCARLVERAEGAELELAHAQGQVQQLQQRVRLLTKKRDRSADSGSTALQVRFCAGYMLLPAVHWNGYASVRQQVQYL